MYKISVPISLETMNENSLPIFAEECKKGGVDRVFVTRLSPFYKKDCYIYKEPEKIKKAIDFFRSNGFEVGVWTGSFGHGGVLSHDKKTDYVRDFARIEGVKGDMAEEAFCPLDENFIKVYENGVKVLSAMKPDMIMLDDDYRLNLRSYNMGCCCEKHMKLFRDILGEEVDRDGLEKLVFSGGKNRYRTAFMKAMGESLENLAARLRAAVDSVDENIRLGVCMCHDIWDFDGTDGIRLAKIFAGKTKPFLRTIGAPYHGMNVATHAEQTRMQVSWCADEDIEVFTEGDVYPRPRYNVSSKQLEMFDMMLRVSGEPDGILKYMFDYNRDVSYEMGYNKRNIRNKPVYDGIARLFGDKKPVGVKVFEAMHKVEDFVLPSECKERTATSLTHCFNSPAQRLLSDNAVSAVYSGQTDYPVIVFGENARHIDLADLKNGAILDAVAAGILKERNVDTGVVSMEKKLYNTELFPKENDEIPGIGVSSYKMTVKDGANAVSLYEDGSAASYLYENAEGTRFYVLAIDSYAGYFGEGAGAKNYYNNYHRQKQLVEGIEWLCGKTLPAKCLKNPYLYMPVSKSADGERMSVALFDVSFDEIIDADVILDKEYKSIEFLGCTGTLCGNKVIIDYVEPYGFAAFEVC